MLLISIAADSGLVVNSANLDDGIEIPITRVLSDGDTSIALLSDRLRLPTGPFIPPDRLFWMLA